LVQLPPQRPNTPRSQSRLQSQCPAPTQQVNPPDSRSQAPAPSVPIAPALPYRKWYSQPVLRHLSFLFQALPLQHLKLLQHPPVVLQPPLVLPPATVTARKLLDPAQSLMAHLLEVRQLKLLPTLALWSASAPSSVCWPLSLSLLWLCKYDIQLVETGIRKQFMGLLD